MLFPLYACDDCNWSYFTIQEMPKICPHCFVGKLDKVENENLDERLRHPELLLPYSLQVEELARRLDQFATGFWFAPPDMTGKNLQSRAKMLYFPMWLVDADVQATWKAEVGYDYSVVSHRDQYDESRAGWSSQKVTEDRVRWETRLGKLQRTYTNISAPAMEEHDSLSRLLGIFDLEKAQSYNEQTFVDSLVCLPTRPSQDAWQDAVPAIQSAAALECQQAAKAHHIRSFEWKPEYQSLKWTLLLLPFISTYYMDDDRNPQGVILNGRTGKLSGQRKASMERAKNAAWWILGSSAVIFVLSIVLLLVGLMVPPMAIAGGIGIFIAIAVCLAAVIPPVIVWNENRQIKNMKLF